MESLSFVGKEPKKRGRPRLVKEESTAERRAHYFRDHPAHHELVAINALARRADIQYTFKAVIGEYVAGFHFPAKNLIIEIESLNPGRNVFVSKQCAALTVEGYHVTTLPTYEAKNIVHHYDKL